MMDRRREEIAQLMDVTMADGLRDLRLALETETSLKAVDFDNRGPHLLAHFYLCFVLSPSRVTLL